MLYDANGNVITIESTGVSDTVAPYNLVVMSFNVQKWQKLNSDATLMKRIIDTYKPDIIGLQEYTQTISGASVYSTIFKDYPYHYFGSSIFNPVGIVSKYALTDTSTVIYASQGAEKRGYTKAYFTFNQQKICWLNTHLEIMPTTAGSRKVRTAQAQELLNVMKAEPYAICTGDFNCGMCHDDTDPDHTAVMKPFLDLGYHSANSSHQHGFLATWLGGTSISNSREYWCIDQVITTSNIDINMVTVDKQKNDANTNAYPLDHFPIVAYCRVNG